MDSTFWLLGIVLLLGVAWTHVFESLGYPLRSKTAGSNGHSVLRSEAQPNCFARFYSPICHEGSDSSTSLPARVGGIFFTLAVLLCMSGYPTVVSMSNDVHVSMGDDERIYVIINICVSLLHKILFSVLSLFLEQF